MLLFIYKNLSFYNIKKSLKYIRHFGLFNFIGRIKGGNTEMSKVEYDEFFNKNYGSTELIKGDIKEITVNGIRFGRYSQGGVKDFDKYDYMFFLHKDSKINKDTFELFAEDIRSTEAQLVYSDEDEWSIDSKGTACIYDNPFMKPDFDIDLMRSMNYIGHACVIKSELVKAAVKQQEALKTDIISEEAQYYDMLLRCIEQCKIISHIPYVLIHESKANKEAYKMPLQEQCAAVNEHLKRMGVSGYAKGIEKGNFCKVIYEYEKESLISIIIPNKDHSEDLNRCIHSFINSTTYKNIEIIIVENNSEKAETFFYYSTVLAQYKNIRVVKWDKPFDYAAINNYGVKYASGEYILFLNNDVKMLSEDCIEQMYRVCQREAVGAVGAQLLYDDNTIQHAGIIVGLGGVADNLFAGEQKDSGKYHYRTSVMQEFSAVTAACMMTKRELFDKVGGFSREFPVAFNDVDYCLKLRDLNKLIVYNPDVLLYHYESKTRGKDVKFLQIKRFKREIRNFRKKWKRKLISGDEYYNKNLTLDRKDYSYKI